MKPLSTSRHLDIYLSPKRHARRRERIAAAIVGTVALFWSAGIALAFCGGVP